MLMAFRMFAKWWKFTTKKISSIINIYFKFSKKDNVYNDFKYQTLKISNEFDLGFVYVFNF
jgi:hypothetical protein